MTTTADPPAAANGETAAQAPGGPGAAGAVGGIEAGAAGAACAGPAQAPIDAAGGAGSGLAGGGGRSAPAARPAGASVSGLGDRVRLHEILTGTWLAQGCYALAKLGLADAMAAGPKPAADLAQQCGLNGPATGRLLRALAAAGLLDEPSPGAFGLTPVTAPLCSTAPRSSRDVAIMFGEEVFRSFAEIAYTVRTGRPGFDHVHGKPFYDYLDGNPDAARTFAAAMGEAPVPASLAACDLSGARVIADIGGGNGRLLTWALRAHPRARGILVDLPPAIASARQRLAKAGLADRVEFAAGSFFDPLPAGADVYVLCRVLHNWPDPDAARLLGRVRDAMGGSGVLIVLEELLAEPTPADGAARRALGDLLILATMSGCDRTRAQYRDLLAAAGFAVRAVRPPESGRAGQVESAIEAVPTDSPAASGDPPAPGPP